LKICNNTVSKNILRGSKFYIDYGSYNVISNNFFNRSSIRIEHGASNNIIINNTIYNPGVFGIYIYNGSKNIFYHNNLIAQKTPDDDWRKCNAIDHSGTNIWYNEELKEGNYWDDYTGKDVDGDGIGDTPYTNMWEEFYDKYPLMTALGIESDPPEKPTISGPTNGKILFWEYTYTANTTDQNGDMLRYIFDWDDGKTTWTEFYYNSGDIVEASHTWNRWGTYQIRVKAKDPYGYESEWSNPLNVVMPRSKGISKYLFLNILERFPILYHLLKDFLNL
jgi:parallel beta-helix repeat protein